MDNKIRPAYVIVPARSGDDGRTMTLQNSYSVPVKENVTDIQAEVDKNTVYLLKSYDEVYVYKLERIAKRSVEYFDFVSGKPVVKEEKATVIDEIEI